MSGGEGERAGEFCFPRLPVIVRMLCAELPILLNFTAFTFVRPTSMAYIKLKPRFYLLNNLSVKLSCCLSNRHVILDLCDLSFPFSG